MSILAIDWGKKRIGMSYTVGKSDIIFPLGSLDNTTNTLYDIAHIVAQRNITTIILGYPSQASFVSRSIDKFITDISFIIDPSVIIEKENEDYSSVEAGAILGSFKKTAAEDTVAAGILLEKYLERLRSKK